MKKVIIRESGCIDGLHTFLDGPFSTILLYTDEYINNLKEFPIEFLDKPRTIFENQVSILWPYEDYIEKHPGGKLYVLKEGIGPYDYDELKIYEK